MTDFKCKVGLHAWEACRCQRCKQVRDEGHAWSGCKCSICGKTREEGHDWGRDCERCARCGKARVNAHDWSTNCEVCARCGKLRRNAHVWNGRKCTACRQTCLVPGEILMFELAHGRFGAIRVLGSRSTMDRTKLTKYAAEDLDDRRKTETCVYATRWQGNAPPDPTDPRLLQPLYTVWTNYIQDYYEPLVRWVLDADRLDSLHVIATVPLGEELSFGILVPFNNWRDLKEYILRQFESQESATPEFIATATEEQLKLAANFRQGTGNSFGPELDDLIGELILIGGRFDFHEPGGGPHARARSIGQRLNEEGGLNLMTAVWWKIAGAQKRLSMQSLNNCWHGIGGWTA